MTEKQFIGRPMSSIDKTTHVAYFMLMLISCLVGFYFGLLEGREDHKNELRKFILTPISSIHFILKTEKNRYLYTNNSFDKDTLKLHRMEMSK